MARDHDTGIHKPHVDRWIGLGLVVLALAIYGMSLYHPFFWDDPQELGRAQARSIISLFTTSRGYIYYRPLTFTAWKLIGSLQGRFDPLTFHLIQVVTHALNGILTYALARRLSDRRSVATAAAVLFVLYPPSYQAVTWVAVSQVQLTTLLLGALITYYDGRVSGNRRLLWISLALTVVALPVHENGMTFGIIVSGLEGVILCREPGACSENWAQFLRQRARRWWPFPALHLLACAAFFILWLFIPKDTSLAHLWFEPAVGWYLTQGFIWPVAGAIGPWRAWFSGPAWHLLAVMAPITSCWLLVAHWRGRQLSLFFFSTLWFAVTVVPAWAGQGIGYVGLAPRLFYIGSPAVALVWAGLLGLDMRLPLAGSRLRDWGWKIGTGALVTIVTWQSAVFVGVRNHMYAGAMPAVWDVVHHGAAEGEQAKLLFINAPDRIAIRAPEYPVGEFLVIVMPIDVDLGRYVALHTGVRPTTQSLSVPELSGLDRYPYHVNMRGVIAQPDTLARAIRAADRVFFTEYRPDGMIRIVEAGSVSTGWVSTKLLATFGNVLQLEEATFEAPNRLVLQWTCLGPGAPDDTVFIHVTGEDKKPIVQADGDLLRGLWPLENCQAGEHIRDVRELSLKDMPAGEYLIRVGTYNRVTARRLQARDARGQAAPDDSVVAAVWRKPPASVP